MSVLEPEAKIPPMHELIEDYGRSTQVLCMNCRAKNRFRFLSEISFREDKTKVRDWFRVCPWCDVEPAQLNQTEGEA